MNLKNAKIGVIGLGYVGLPLAMAFSEKYEVVGFDTSSDRVTQLTLGIDKTGEVNNRDLASENLVFTNTPDLLKSCNVFIITVPTPIDRVNLPVLKPLEAASRTVGEYLTGGSVVIYESTVYPGATEEYCVPILESVSDLRCNEDFYVGYSPERINPGDKDHSIKTIVKVTSGSTPESAEFIDRLYGSIISAGTYKAPSIKVAEAAKVIENSQRDLNIAFVNELSQIFARLEIDTSAVLRAASTKWNFLHFKPGLVGGHCIGVDPYYLAYRARETGYSPDVLLAGRKLNDSMASYVASQLIKLMVKRDFVINQTRILVMGITFKENCPDTRNSKVLDVINELISYGCAVDVIDPVVDPIELHQLASDRFGVVDSLDRSRYEGILVAVPHEDFVVLGPEKICAAGKSNCVIYDLKSIYPESISDLRL